MNSENSHIQSRESVLQLRCEPIECVRIGFIGLGVRAKRAVLRMMHIAGCRPVALCDLVEENINEAKDIILKHGGETPATFSTDDGWKKVCEMPSVDLIYICTDWTSHADIAVYAMQCGKHVATEVPAATTVADCWRLVDTAEENRRHCIMLENCCYDEFEMTLMNMSQKGMLGEIIHAEGSYLHDLRERISTNDQGGRKWSNWQVEFMDRHNGNPYPTHGLGPVALAMGIHRGDRMESIVSVSSKRIGETTGGSLNGNMNTSVVTTAKGYTIGIQHCISLPRPYSRSFLLSGTKGFAQKYPVPHMAFAPDCDSVIMDRELEKLMIKHTHPITEQYKKRGLELCGRRWIDYAMDCRLIYCLNKGLPLDMDVYDAAEWSCLVELTDISANAGGAPVEVPDFTRGRWNEEKGHTFHNI
ncbi:MAG: Gfo/Idh/MocA family oxidoreductase [Bacteroidaceae bacterium]|nr:Gfo/Idh/MocA family oxidoreductase [Bacteroidaceae bacterium]